MINFNCVKKYGPKFYISSCFTFVVVRLDPVHLLDVVDKKRCLDDLHVVPEVDASRLYSCMHPSASACPPTPADDIEVLEEVLGGVLLAPQNRDS